MTTEELKRGDQILYGRRILLVDSFDEENGTKLNDGRWICASHLTNVGPRRWQYTPKNPEEMTVAELVFEHRQTVEAVLKGRIHGQIRAAILPDIEKRIAEAADDVVQHVMREIYQTPPRLMGKDTTTS